jgi:hypothetical protein
MKYSVHQPQYLAWLGFFDKIAKSDVFVVLDQVQYKHREYQNRNRIRTKDGWMWLSVPVLYSSGVLMRDVMIDQARDWRSEHLKSLRSWYARAPYFEKHIGYFESLYAKPWSRLFDLNMDQLGFFLKELGITTRIVLESDLGAGGVKTERIVNIGRALGASTYLSGAGGKDYLDEPAFGAAGLGLEYQHFENPKYAQLFMKDKDDFVGYLSIVDLLFNEGPRSREILRTGTGGRNHV